MEPTKEYRKTATVKAKLFEQGDEDGFENNNPYISTLENQKHLGEFGKHYICVGIKNERWLVDKEIFERTYESVSPSQPDATSDEILKKHLKACYETHGEKLSEKYHGYLLCAMQEYHFIKCQQMEQGKCDVSGNKANPSANKKAGEVALPVDDVNSVIEILKKHHYTQEEMDECEWDANKIEHLDAHAFDNSVMINLLGGKLDRQ